MELGARPGSHHRSLRSVRSAPVLPSVERTPPGTAGTSRSDPQHNTAAAKRFGGGCSGGIHTRQWTSEQRRLLHERRERAWLRSKGKQRFVDFSDSERAALRRYFDALAEDSHRVKLDKLEDMLISLGLAGNRNDVKTIVQAIKNHHATNGNGNSANGNSNSSSSSSSKSINNPNSPAANDGLRGEHLDFEEYLEIVRTRADSAIFKVFKAMMEGNLGDQNLNFQTVISEYRRQLILDATGARGATGEQLERCRRIMHNFASLQNSRFVEAEQGVHSNSTTHHAFDPGGLAPLGGLGMMWRGVCHDHNLVSSRPASADGKKTRRILEKPLSPRSVIQGIVNPSTSHSPMRQIYHRGTVVISAPEDIGKLKMSSSK